MLVNALTPVKENPMAELLSAGLSPYPFPPDEGSRQQGAQSRIPLKAALANLRDPWWHLELAESCLRNQFHPGLRKVKKV